MVEVKVAYVLEPGRRWVRHLIFACIFGCTNLLEHWILSFQTSRLFSKLTSQQLSSWIMTTLIFKKYNIVPVCQPMLCCIAEIWWTWIKETVNPIINNTPHSEGTSKSRRHIRLSSERWRESLVWCASSHLLGAAHPQVERCCQVGILFQYGNLSPLHLSLDLMEHNWADKAMNELQRAEKVVGYCTWVQCDNITDLFLPFESTDLVLKWIY